MDSAIKFQNNINELNINILNEYKKLFLQYNQGIFISGLTDCKTRKFSLKERIDGLNKIKLNNSRFKEMKEQVPFKLYLIDTLSLSFGVITVNNIYLYKEDIPNKKLFLIPSSILNLYAYAYYEFSNLEIFSYECSNAILNINTGKSLFGVKQINPCTPWRVECIEGDFGSYLKKYPPVLTLEDTFGYYSKYCVYRYYIDLPNCQMSYIGMTKDLQTRFNHHKNPSSWNSKTEKNKMLYMAFKNPTIGYEKFHFEILHDNLTQEEAHYWEAKEIENFNSYFPFGFNIRNESKYLKDNN